jgi:hypothetical protein
MEAVKQLFGKLGSYTSTICMVHCAITPIIIPFISMTSLSFFITERFEFLMMMVAFTSAFITILISFYKYHSKLIPFYYIGLAMILKWAECIFPPHLEIILDIGIGGFLIAAILVNRRLCKACPDCHH